MEHTDQPLHSSESSDRLFGDLLRQLRRAAGWTQAELAERANLSLRGIADLERGVNRHPRRETVLALAEALELPEETRHHFVAAARGRPPDPSVSDPPLPPSSTAEPPESERDPLTPPIFPTGTVTFLFTDIEGSTRLLHHLGEAYALVLREHQRLLRQAWAEYSGIEVDTAGDGFFVVFSTALAAVAAAAAGTRALAAYSWPESGALQVRMGLHTGAPQLVGNRYVGLDVHRTARIAAAGHGGQILLSEATRVLAAHDLPEGTILRDLGAHQLKDLQHPEAIFQLILAGLPADFPPLKTLDTHQHNLLLQPTPLLGREEQLATLGALLRRKEVRLVTLTGPGGIGKTRLAIQAAADLVDAFADGVWLVRLSRLSDPSLMLPTIAQTLGVKESSGQPIEQTLREWVRTRQVLLVLDNFEQIVAAASSVGELLETCPQLKVLVTSRVPLHLRGEREYAVAPLALPNRVLATDLEVLTQYAAVALFIERARDARADFAVTAANAPAIAEICTRLDGLPLAIELAAARVKLLPPETLLARLSSRLKLLTGGARDVEERQRTMQSTIGWSEGLLSPQERLLFRRLAVFVGGCTLEAAEAVCVAPEGAEPLELDLLDGLGALVDQSLVQQREEEGGGGGEPRFGMLHVIREYGLERLDESGETEALRGAHAAYFLMLAERAQPELRGSGQSAWLERLERDHDNLRAALDWSLEHAAAAARARPWVAMLEFWLRRGYWHEGREWMARLLGLRETLPPRERALLLKEAGFVSFIYEDYVSATQWYGESLVLFREVEDQASTGRILSRLAHCAMAEGKLDHARDLLPQALRLLQEVRDDTTVIEVLAVQGDLAELEGNYGAARTAIERAYALAQSAHDTWYADIGRAELSFLDLLQGNVAAAQSAQLEALALQERMKDKSRSGTSLRLLGLVALEQSDVPMALRHLQRSLALFEELAHQGRVSMTLVWLGMARFAAGDLLGAQDAYLRSLRYQHGFAAGQRIAACLECLAELALVHNLPDRAGRLLGAATQFCGELVPPPLPPRLAAQRERVALDARQALGEEAWAESFAAGQALSREEAIAEALQAAT
jgi:predicted ATPase/class 3 adenylate cyclase/DNA-binding XRE family transcriptional regulator